MINLFKSIHYWILLMLLGAVSASTWAQTAPTVQWTTEAREAGYSTPVDNTLILNASNGDYLTFVVSRNMSTFLVRLAANGQFKSSQTLPQSPDSYRVRQAINTRDGGFLAGGYAVRDGFRDRPFLMKFDANGVILWTRISDPVPVSSTFATFVGSIVLVERPAYYAMFTTTRLGNDLIATRQHYDKSGNMIPFQTTPFDQLLGLGQSFNVIAAVEAVDEGTIVAVNDVNFSGAALYKINDSGSSNAIQSFSRSSTIKALEPTAARDGYYVTVSSADSTQVVRIDQNGTKIWSVDIRRQSAYLGLVFDIVAEPNGVVISGTTFNNELKLQKLDLNGNPLWQAYVDRGTPTSLIKTPDGGYATSKFTPSFFKLSPEQTATTPPVVTLALTTPSYDCNTGQLTVNTSGGNGSFIEYRIVGLRDWSNSNTFIVPSYQRNGTTFTLEARQNRQVFRQTFTTACGTTPPVVTPPVIPPVTPPTGTFAVLTPGYDCNTGQLRAQVANAGGSGVEYRIAGLRDWASAADFSVPSYQRTSTTFKIEARTNSGAYASADFTTTCGIVIPPVVTPPSRQTPVSVSNTQFDCVTGELTVNANGPGPEPLEYQIPGLADWQRSNRFVVPDYQRRGTNFTINIRQGNVNASGSFTANCPATARVANAEMGQRWGVSVMGNPVDDQVQLRLSGLAGQTLGLSLSDATGRVLSERQLSVQTEGQTETLNLRGSAGVYLIRAISNGQQQTLKVLKK